MIDDCSKDNEEKEGAHPKKRMPILRLLESKAIVALISVLIGGVLAQYISTSLQRQAQLQEQRLIEHRERLEAAREIVDTSYKLVAEIVAIVERMQKIQSSTSSTEFAKVYVEFRNKEAEWDSRKGYVGYLN